MYRMFSATVVASLYLRHVTNLKGRRRILQSLKQKLIHLGFSVAEWTAEGNPKQAAIGFVFISAEVGQVEGALEKAKRLFIGDFDLVEWESQILDYEPHQWGEDAPISIPPIPND